ncbi:MAG: ABC transporter permease [Candidatus Omnitrophica bacterium]|nr:ABC transporter permease [Candidatus Omnitrophota bacterium]
MLPIEFVISWRYLASKRKEKFISIISVISVLGVAIGVAALIIVLAVMAGFDKDLKEKIIGNYSHIVIAKDTNIDDYPAFRMALLNFPHIKGVSAQMHGQVFVISGNRIFALGLKGIDIQTEPSVSRIKEYIVRGDLKNLGENSVVIGKELALYLGLDIGDSLRVFSPLGKAYELKVAGIFNSGMYEYDLNLIYVSLNQAREMFGAKYGVSEIAIKLDNLYLAERIRNDLQKFLGYDYSVKTWMQKNPNFFAALKLEKLTMFIILTLIILVACFNIVSTLIVMVTDKIKDIGILKAVGVTAAGIRRIFTLEGLLIGFLGVMFGALGGVSACLLLKKYQFIKLPADIYYLDRLPVSLVWWPDITVIVISALFIALISTIYPAYKASKLNTVEALRYE